VWKTTDSPAVARCIATDSRGTSFPQLPRLPVEGRNPPVTIHAASAASTALAHALSGDIPPMRGSCPQVSTLIHTLCIVIHNRFHACDTMAPSRAGAAVMNLPLPTDRFTGIPARWPLMRSLLPRSSRAASCGMSNRRRQARVETRSRRWQRHVFSTSRACAGSPAPRSRGGGEMTALRRFRRSLHPRRFLRGRSHRFDSREPDRARSKSTPRVISIGMVRSRDPRS
jgi:hypothetical protein